MITVAIVGASGYTGLELIRLLDRHPEVTITSVTSEQSAGRPISDLFPTLRGRCDLLLEPLDPATIAAKAELIFTALPHQAAMAVVPAFLEAGRKVIDLSADYRLHDPAVYGAWYEAHKNPELLQAAVYGLPELRRETIRPACLVANPGCYPTSIILGLKPLLDAGLIDPATIIADSGSGVSGAGRAAKVDSLYCEVNEGFKAYGVGGLHRHTPEIEQELSELAGQPVTITFTPHLVPMDRGILSTIYATPTRAVTTDELVALYAAAYRDEPFVRPLSKGQLPCTAFVRGSNFCDIGVTVDSRTNRVIVVSAIDNLVKGASGQAVQNMNLLCGFPETQGLEGLALYP
ncbi:N-acetyl-gamma-glutamyl-phosphate reductase [Trichlorobacter sp.]|jgi:N-acetyl-gamma-glutamyl-phosphate reductase|uniref:N-acetyl-gamma-glutamyl-phosphate reductase n=1 Tax=Trichlorobacter sp. TaxID=2911007 RepID=UPI002A35E791|nr:N-acetyl-gamma-glutamyl-phosphate reductase [Trichlorobacter sp.]MDY0383253.1 N-acetyl-gamma-glutamyl-phosphate reductase [Trichlorobacter sp.]